MHTGPWVLSPEREGLRYGSRLELAAWLANRAAELRAELDRRGAILLRGFPIESAESFAEAVRVLAGDAPLLGYEGGIAPRSLVASKVFTATNAPAYMKITPHSEMTHMPHFPRQMLFYCDFPPKQGGETPIVDTRAVFKAVPRQIRERFERLGVLYVRDLSALTPLKRALERVNPLFGMSTWQRAYGADSRTSMEARCRGLGLELEWSGRRIRTRVRLPAVRAHPVTREHVWFNSAHNYLVHRRVFGPILVNVFRLYRSFFAETLDACYGDGSPITTDEKLAILDAVDENTTTFRWQKGDVLLLDNLLMMHGRNPYKGKRRILVSMVGEPRAAE
jgi:alpha-ketoglutarate-dependent taurine dioxygenase